MKYVDMFYYIFAIIAGFASLLGAQTINKARKIFEKDDYKNKRTWRNYQILFIIGAILVLVISLYMIIFSFKGLILLLT